MVESRKTRETNAKLHFTKDEDLVHNTIFFDNTVCTFYIICNHFFLFSVGWAAFDDFELVADNKDEECAIKPPEAVPHIPSLGDCTFQVFNYKIKEVC